MAATITKKTAVTNKIPQLPKKSSVIAIIPAYNEAPNIQKIIEETRKYVGSIIVIDDGSEDNTAELARSMNVRVIRNNRNLGKGAAIKRGLFECSRYNVDIVITLDADGQHDPAEIPKILKPIEEGQAEIVIGSRYERSHLNEIPKYRRIGLSIINSMNRLLIESHVSDSQSGFRAYAKSALGAIADYSTTGYGAETEQLASAEYLGLRILEVPINIRYHELNKTSKRNPVVHGANILSTILRIAVEKRPLLFFGLTGIILMGAAILTTSDMLIIFNKSRYFSIPLALITIGLALLGALLLLSSLVFYAIRTIRERYKIAAIFSDTANGVT